MTMNRDLWPHLPGEMDAVDRAMAAAAQYGYGNIISRLQEAWSMHLQKGGLSKDAAEAGAWMPRAFWREIDELKKELALARQVIEASRRFMVSRAVVEKEVDWDMHDAVNAALAAYDKGRG